MSVLWQVGWVIGGVWYALLQANLGFDAGYAVAFLTIITLYTVATCLYWIWFRAVDREPGAGSRRQGPPVGLGGRRAHATGHARRLVEMGESRTPRPGPFAGDHYERVRWFVVDRPDGHRHPAGRSSHVSLDRA